MTTGPAAALEATLGDPGAPGNPFGFGAVVAADEAGTALPGALDLLTTLDWHAELVPPSEGGRLTSLPYLVQLLRPLFRRDVTVGLAAGVVPLLSSTLVWAAPSATTRQQLARRLLDDRRLPLATYAETEGGAGVSAHQYGAEVVLQGRTCAVTGSGWDAPAAVVARTGRDLGCPRHTVVLVDNATRPQTTRQPAGARGLRFGELLFDDPKSYDGATIVGDFSGASGLTRSALAITRTTLAGATVASLDTLLRLAVGSALEQPRLLPHVRSALAAAFLDLLTLDCLTTVGARALQAFPTLSGAYLDAINRLSAVLTRQIINGLDGVLGIEAHRRDGRYAIFQKHRRDLLTAPLTASGGARGRSALLPILPDGTTTQTEEPGVLFGLAESLQPLDPARLAAGSPSLEDPLGGFHRAQYGIPNADVVFDVTARVLASCAALPPRDRTPLATPEACQLAEQYAVLVAARSCLGVWQENQQDAFLRDPAWVTGALQRLVGRLGEPNRRQRTTDEHLLTELVDRHRQRTAFDLTAAPVAG
ncbi:hypothetical protein [Kribbella sp. CA-293567]|uniref:hypothetical protein n=1 Tax=Kribbella sp. CA-293567 TaxID=3002436 RepID=UPI0022DD1291|nr:hypothetical protein [Kribbella sp. CA-293567]WBQ08253.1 hypothetical protein OX958_15930 [Kribbella sp. CA-293567]